MTVLFTKSLFLLLTLADLILVNRFRKLLCLVSNLQRCKTWITTTFILNKCHLCPVCWVCCDFLLFVFSPSFHLHITAYSVICVFHFRKQVSINLFSQLYCVSAVAHVLYITFQLYLSYQMGVFPRRRHLYLQQLDFFLNWCTICANMWRAWTSSFSDILSHFWPPTSWRRTRISHDDVQIEWSQSYDAHGSRRLRSCRTSLVYF